MAASGSKHVDIGTADMRREADAGTTLPQICDCYELADASEPTLAPVKNSPELRDLSNAQVRKASAKEVL